MMISLWNQETEKQFFGEALRYTAEESLFYRTDTGKSIAYWPKGYKGTKSTLQSRNSFIGKFTERWIVELLSHYASSRGLYALQGVICENIGLSSKSPADVALCKTNTVYQQAENIAVIFEVKMSVVWNWEYRDGVLIQLGDFTTHQGNPGLLRSDTMLKAIGKGINIRVCDPLSAGIPIIVLGNTPIMESYYTKVDHLKKCGIIQGFWSVNPEPKGEIITLKATEEEGFVKMDSYDELVAHLDNLLIQKLTFFSSMKSMQELGEIIQIADREETFEGKAGRFLELIRR